MVTQLQAERIVAPLAMLFDKASKLQFVLRECRHFTLIDEKHLAALDQSDSSLYQEWFWRQLKQLVILVSRSNAKATLNLIAGLTDSVTTRNELVLAFCARGFIEHAAAHYFLWKAIENKHVRIREHLHNSSPAIDSVTQADEEVRQLLIRFAIGRRVDVANLNPPELSESNEKWKAFSNAMWKSVAEHNEAVDIKEMINAIIQSPGRQFLRPYHSLLSEYCHPNSASRTLDFQTIMTGEKNHRLVTSDSAVSSSFAKLVVMCRYLVPVCCDVIAHGLTSLAKLSPMPGERTVSPDPFPGASRFVDEFGRTGWLPFGSIAVIPTGKKENLTPKQVERIRIIQDAFAEVDPTPFDVTLAFFASEGANLEAEIALWERLVKVYELEVRERNADGWLRQLLYDAIVRASTVATTADVLAVMPWLREIENLERIVSRVKSL